MRKCAALLFALVLAGCGQVPPAPDFLHDELFAAPSRPVSAAEVFALSEPMKRYVATELAPQVRAKGERQALIDVFTRGDLKLQYDAVMTRTAAQAFEARAGNCLSLTIMTAALAKEIGIEPVYNVTEGDLWSRNNNIYFLNAHVNVTLPLSLSYAHSRYDRATMTVDFVPGPEVMGLRTHEVDESTIVAMFMNNRSAEMLAADRVDDAYWLAREAVLQSSDFMGAYNTMGVVYLRRGEPRIAEHVFKRVLEREPENTRALANLALALQRLQRPEEAAAVERKLTKIERIAPFYFFQRGLAAMEAGEYGAARTLFEKELGRAPDYHEFHFWLAVAELNLGNVDRAREEILLALENSNTREAHALYAAKLHRLATRH